MTLTSEMAATRLRRPKKVTIVLWLWSSGDNIYVQVWGRWLVNRSSFVGGIRVVRGLAGHRCGQSRFYGLQSISWASCGDDMQ